MLYAHLQSQMRSPTAPTPGGNGTLATVAAARASVISLLRSTAELRGDELAAEFTLLHLLSHVRARPHGLAAPPIGDLPLNLILPNAGACGGTEVPRGTIEPGKTSQPLRLLQLLILLVLSQMAQMAVWTMPVWIPVTLLCWPVSVGLLRRYQQVARAVGWTMRRL